MGIKVAHYNAESGICQLRDEHGRRFTAKCEPTGRKKPNEDQKSKREESDMQTETYENAGEELDAKVHAYADKRGCSYAEAMHHVTREEPELAERYVFGEGDVNPEDKKGAEEFGRRVKAYCEEFHITRDEAERRVRAHDPNMRKYFRQGGSIAMSTEQVPLDPGSVVDVRAQELMSKGEIKSYGEAMKAVLAEDPLLAECYRANKPYVEASAKSYHSYQDEMPNVGAKQQLGVLINGARLASNAPDISLMIRIANLTPDLVRGASGERLDELANAITAKPGMPQGRAEAYPIALRQVRQEHPELVAASESGVLNEMALKEIFYPWFTERD